MRDDVPCVVAVLALMFARATVDFFEVDYHGCLKPLGNVRPLHFNIIEVIICRSAK
jgi:hypothetical protein